MGWRQSLRSARLPRGLRPWFIAAAILLVVHWSLIIVFVAPQVGTLDFLRLHYTVAFGIDWIDRWYMIFVFPIVGATALVVNTWLVLLLSARYRGLATVVSQVTLFVEAALVIGGVSAVLLNA